MDGNRPTVKRDESPLSRKRLKTVRFGIDPSSSSVGEVSAAWKSRCTFQLHKVKQSVVAGPESPDLDEDSVQKSNFLMNCLKHPNSTTMELLN